MKKEKKLWKCPYCGMGNVKVDTENQVAAVAEDGVLLYDGECDECGEYFYAAYQFGGFMTKEQIDKNFPRYAVRVYIKGTTAESYAEQWVGNPETDEIMSEYLDNPGQPGCEFYKTFRDYGDAVKEYRKQCAFHENENGDAMNIRETRDVSSRDTSFMQVIILCEDGHDITITLEEIKKETETD